MLWKYGLANCNRTSLIPKQVTAYITTARVIVTAGIISLLALTACNTNSDALSVLQAENTSLKATIGSYEGIGPTMTAQATAIAQKVASVENDLATERAKNRDLISRLNGGSTAGNGAVQPSSGNSMDTTGSTADNTLNSTSNNATGNTALDPNPKGASGSGSAPTPADPNGFGINQIVTARNKDANGCAVGQSNIFTTSDSAIWVIADVRNYKRGTQFTAKWAGDSFTHENSWTVSGSGSQICVHFYIEPDTLSLKAGSYTVTIAATGLQPQSIPFTVQAGTSQAEGTSNP